jgi:hypothetical protein
VLVLPLILYSDDLSGNRSKKWNKFDCIAFLLAGLPKEMNTNLRNIHLISASNRVTVLEMLQPLADELKMLQSGTFLFDAYWNEVVFVYAPVLMVICDNPRSSELLGHMTGNPKKFCRLCMCDRTVDPTVTSRRRSKSESLDICTQISMACDVKAKENIKTSFGLTGKTNPLFELDVDLFQSTPIECLHTILLGPYKYLLRHVMENLTSTQKVEISARLNAFPFSGFKYKLKANICRYVGSLVGRDFKAFAQLALYILGPYLNESEMLAWLFLSKIFAATYIDIVDVTKSSHYVAITTGFISALKIAYPDFLKKAKIHLLLHLPEVLLQFGPTSAYNTERCESFNSLVRTANVYSNKQAPSRDIATSFSVNETLYHISCGAIIQGRRAGEGLLELFKMDFVNKFLNNGCHSLQCFHGVLRKLRRDERNNPVVATVQSSLNLSVSSNSSSKLCGTTTPASHINVNSDVTLPGNPYGTVYNALIGRDGGIINTGDCIEAVNDNEIVYGILISCLQAANRISFCVIRLFDHVGVDNEYDCPLFTLTDDILLIPAIKISKSVNMLHQCDKDCVFVRSSGCHIIERETVDLSNEITCFQHNFNNNLYFLNIYCMN